MNALCYHLKEQVTKRDYEYFVLYDGAKRGVYHTWGALLKAVGRRNTPQGWRCFYSKTAAESSLAIYLGTSKQTERQQVPDLIDLSPEPQQKKNKGKEPMVSINDLRRSFEISNNFKVLSIEKEMKDCPSTKRTLCEIRDEGLPLNRKTKADGLKLQTKVSHSNNYERFSTLMGMKRNF